MELYARGANLMIPHGMGYDPAKMHIPPAPEVNSGGGMLSHLHKVKGGAHVYCFANSSNDRVDTWVKLRGKLTLQAWDPRSGTMTPAECLQITNKEQDITRFRLVLEPVKSVFLTESFATAGPETKTR